MVSTDVQISELKYQIRKKQTEIEHIDKVLATKRRNNLLTPFSEQELHKEQEQLALVIEDIERRIRGMENAETRKKNLVG